jgi:hypothetical protein
MTRLDAVLSELDGAMQDLISAQNRLRRLTPIVHQLTDDPRQASEPAIDPLTPTNPPDDLPMIEVQSLERKLGSPASYPVTRTNPPGDPLRDPAASPDPAIP